ncbi:serine/threonine-protein phosphatase 4 regulatory subunit 2-A-like [Mizuhopecten yessoensis]|uniref:Serine/threonine-protein phosphatase 4 regulatory subunit 2-B n=1 Tax=Mizuhopecten yessoensis TaxID=6573 RepID=A0A210PFT7_MIZYE|nr:serine/threonine-protein phosphatase 4 regulatory subunit 2-A-like [Mizuhopecten yessoensis]OWF35316.1 Serine/threonine-protein phosphatase 4 regulatory subunit 2-B [Mizuhopecten yessoensis]
MVRAEEINMENQEDVLDALCCYEKKPTPDIPPVLDQYLRRVAKTGETLFPWQQLKILFIHKLDSVITQFNQDFPADHLQNCPNVENVKFEEMKKRVVCSLEEFQGAPFTIQRLCELVTEPKKHYKRTDKFLRGIEKNVLVVSTVDPFGRKIVSDSRPMMNGLDMNGYNGERPESKPHFSTFPSPSSHQTTWPSERVYSPELSKELSNPLHETEVSASPNFPRSDGEKVQPAMERVEQQTEPQIKSQENITSTENVINPDAGTGSLLPDTTPSTEGGTDEDDTRISGSESSDNLNQVTPQQSNPEPEAKEVQQSSEAEHSTVVTPLDTTHMDEDNKPIDKQSQEVEDKEDLPVSEDTQDSDQVSSSSSLSSSSSPEPIKEQEESASKESELTGVTTSDASGSEDSPVEPSSFPVSQDTASTASTAPCASSVESSTSTDSPNDTPSVEIPLASSSTVQSDSTTEGDNMETDSTVPSSDSVADSDQLENNNEESRTNNENNSNCEDEVKVESESSSGASESTATPMEED